MHECLIIIDLQERNLSLYSFPKIISAFVANK